MRTEAVRQEMERLDPREIELLRERLHAEAPDALTVDDVAEAAGVSVDEVRMALRQLRAERALGTAATKRGSQAALLGLALVLFGLSGTIWYLRQPPDTEAMLREVQHERALRVAQRLKENPPPEVSIPSSAPMPPAGIILDVHAVHKMGTLEGTKGQTLLPISFEHRLADSLDAIVKLVAEAESKRPQGAKPINYAATRFPLSESHHRPPTPEMLTIGINDRYAQSFAVPIKTALNPVLRRRFASSTASQYTKQIASIWSSVMNPPKSMKVSGPTMPPPGFSLELHSGDATASVGGSGLMLAPPSSNGVESKLLASLKDLVSQHNLTRTPYAFEATSKREYVPPATATVTIRGPIKEVVFVVPTNVSRIFPTAAQVLQASDQSLRKHAKEAARQIDEVIALAKAAG